VYILYVWVWDSPVIVPCTTVPFLSSIVTVSLLSFIKNLGKANQPADFHDYSLAIPFHLVLVIALPSHSTNTPQIPHIVTQQADVDT
jgi:hypothetical protein